MGTAPVPVGPPLPPLYLEEESPGEVARDERLDPLHTNGPPIMQRAATPPWVLRWGALRIGASIKGQHWDW